MDLRETEGGGDREDGSGRWPGIVNSTKVILSSEGHPLACAMCVLALERLINFSKVVFINKIILHVVRPNNIRSWLAAFIMRSEKTDFRSIDYLQTCQEDLTFPNASDMSLVPSPCFLVISLSYCSDSITPTYSLPLPYLTPLLN